MPSCCTRTTCVPVDGRIASREVSTAMVRLPCAPLRCARPRLYVPAVATADGPASRPPELQLLERRDVGKARDEADRGLLHSGTDAGQGRQLVDRREERALVHQALDLMQHRLARGPIQLACLALEEVVDLRDHPGG